MTETWGKSSSNKDVCLYLCVFGSECVFCGQTVKICHDCSLTLLTCGNTTFHFRTLSCFYGVTLSLSHTHTAPSGYTCPILPPLSHRLPLFTFCVTISFASIWMVLAQKSITAHSAAKTHMNSVHLHLKLSPFTVLPFAVTTLARTHVSIHPSIILNAFPREGHSIAGFRPTQGLIQTWRHLAASWLHTQVKHTPTIVNPAFP